MLESSGSVWVRNLTIEERIGTSQASSFHNPWIIHNSPLPDWTFCDRHISAVELTVQMSSLVVNVSIRRRKCLETSWLLVWSECCSFRHIDLWQFLSALVFSLNIDERHERILMPLNSVWNLGIVWKQICIQACKNELLFLREVQRGNLQWQRYKVVFSSQYLTLKLGSTYYFSGEIRAHLACKRSWKVQWRILQIRWNLIKFPVKVSADKKRAFALTLLPTA